MVLAHATWPDISALSRDVVVLIPTGSLEQHGPHLPLFTDSILVTHVAEQIEKQIPDKVLLTPTLWLGGSGHHLAFDGSLSNSMQGYQEALTQVVSSLRRHGFWKFFVLNGHGGNTELNGITLRSIKEKDREIMVGHSGYFAYCEDTVAEIMEGPLKGIRHACEAEASMMLAVRPDLVRADKLRSDGMEFEPSLRGMIQMFDEITEEGSYGYATLATKEKGEKILNAAIVSAVQEMSALASGYVLKSLPPL
ncbi:MAG: creatininase family protein [Armatimonadetes bacterium]|nr:creatininase family protein [Armatimonadota bacterium]